MPSDPIAISRKHVPPTKPGANRSSDIRSYKDLSVPVGSTALIGALVIYNAWAHRWFFSGAGVESLLLIYSSSKVGIAIALPLLNLVYLVVYKFWASFVCFTVVCYILVPVTAITQFRYPSAFTRRVLRRVLAPLQITPEKIAWFDLPGLEIDIGPAYGLMVVRSLTFLPFQLTVQFHGVELGFNVQDDSELALYVDEIHIRLFRGIDFGEVYGALRSAKVKNKGGVDGKPLHYTHASLPIGDEKANEQYSNRLSDISSSSRISTSREEVKRSRESSSVSLSAQQMRAKLASALLNFSAVPHAPARSIRVTQILERIPRWLRRFISRVPLLIRLLLMPLSYLHPLTVTSVNVSGSGKCVADALRGHSKLEYWAEQDPEFRDVYDRFRQWLCGADICFDFAALEGLVQVPVRKMSHIVAWLNCGNMTAFRVWGADGAEIALQLNGADATFVVPSFLLPCHEHIVPRDEDTTEVRMKTHGSFPVTINQTLLDFASELTKASKVFEMEAEQQLTDDDPPQSTAGKLADSVKHPRHNAKAIVKKLMASEVIDDSWIADLIGKLATQLERIQGEVGYSGGFKVALELYCKKESNR